MEFFNKVRDRFAQAIRENNEENPLSFKKNRPEIPERILFKCPRCLKAIFSEDFIKNRKVCPNCNYHARITAGERINLTADPDSFIEFNADLIGKNPIDFDGYEQKLESIRSETGLTEAIVTGKCLIRGFPAIVGIMDSRFMMASMGTAVGEKIVLSFEKAGEEKLPVILFTASGGARMQEGIFSLMQMTKTSAAIARFSKEGGLYITVMTDPTTGGVTASFASLGDIIIAEPKSLIGFAGRRVIRETIKQDLPDDFQSAEFLEEHGFIDLICERKNMRRTLASLLNLHGFKKIPPTPLTNP